MQVWQSWVGADSTGAYPALARPGAKSAWFEGRELTSAGDHASGDSVLGEYLTGEEELPISVRNKELVDGEAVQAASGVLSMDSAAIMRCDLLFEARRSSNTTTHRNPKSKPVINADRVEKDSVVEI